MTAPDWTVPSVPSVGVADLLERLKLGRADAGPSLISMCGARLAQYARLLAPEFSDADRDELCEYAVERAIERVHLYDSSRGTFESWLRGFLRREVYEFSRRTRSVPIPDDELDRRGLPLISTSFYDEKYAERRQLRERKEALQILVCTLSATDQLIIALRDYERLPYKTIAERLNVSELACRQRYSRALNRLKSKTYDNPAFADLWEDSSG